MAIQIGEKASPTFAQPLDLMSDCHRRVEKFLRTLILVPEQEQGRALTQLQRVEMQAALRYFRDAAPRHTADEEESLFPRIRQVTSAEMGEALRQVAALEADHAVAKRAHDAVEVLGQKWLKTDALDEGELAEFVANLQQLASIYGNHIRVEDTQVFPLAKKVLSAAEIEEIGMEMAHRRGQPFRTI